MNPIYTNETHLPLDPAVEAALYNQPLASVPPGLAAGVMAHIAAERESASPAAVNWRIVGAAALAATLAVLGGLLVIQAQLPRLLTPENVLLVRLEVWYQLQRLLFVWLALSSELRLAPSPGLLRGVLALNALWLFAALLALALGAGLLAAVRFLARRPAAG